MKSHSLLALRLPALALALPLQATAQEASCSDMEWSPELRTQFPEIDEACQEVVVRGDRRFARFDAEFQDYRATRGDLRLNFTLADQRTVSHVLRLDRDLRVNIGGREYRFSELSRRQPLEVFIPERSMTLATLGEEPDDIQESEMTVVQDDERVAGEQTPATEPEAGEIAQMETEEDERLPATASQWPLIGLIGLMLLGVAGGLRLARGHS